RNTHPLLDDRRGRNPDAQDKAPARELLEPRRRKRNQRRRTGEDGHDRRAETHPLGNRRRRGDRRDRVAGKGLVRPAVAITQFLRMADQLAEMAVLKAVERYRDSKTHHEATSIRPAPRRARWFLS